MANHWAGWTPPPDRSVRAPRVRLDLPAGHLTPRTPCPHAETPIPEGEPTVCLICHRSGLDGIHPALARDPKTDPKPEPKVQEKPAPEPSRRERRKILAELTAEQRREELKAEKDARRFRRARREAERRAANSSPRRPT